MHPRYREIVYPLDHGYLEDMHAGHKTREEYLKKRTELQAELAKPKPAEDRQVDLQKAAELLGQFCLAWKAANREQQKKIARLIFDELGVDSNELVA